MGFLFWEELNEQPNLILGWQIDRFAFLVYSGDRDSSILVGKFNR